MRPDPYRRLVTRHALIMAALAMIVFLKHVSPHHVIHAEIVAAFLWFLD